jgi:hypothetical protein
MTMRSDRWRDKIIFDHGGVEADDPAILAKG